MNEPRGTLTVRGPDTCDPRHRPAKPVTPLRTRVSARSAGAPRTAFVLAGGAVHALTRLFGARLQADLARYATAAELIVLPAVNPQGTPLTSFTHARELAAQALTAARTTLAAHDTHPARALAS